MLSSILVPLTAMLALTTPVLGRITNITFPATAQVGGTVAANVSDYSYIQNWDDFGIIFGLKPTSLSTCWTCAGTEQYYVNLYNSTEFEDSSGRRKRHYIINVPLHNGVSANTTYTIVAAVPYLVGASGSTGIRYWNSTLTVTA